MTLDTMLASFDRLTGSWTTEATHPMMSGVVVHGTLYVEWLEGRRFLLLRSRTDHPDFPDGLNVVGDMSHDRIDPTTHSVSAAADPGSLGMSYFDERGVFRKCETRMDDTSWQVWRDAPGFSQRFTGTWSNDGDEIVGQWELREDDVHWKNDLAIRYRRKR